MLHNDLQHRIENINKEIEELVINFFKVNCRCIDKKIYCSCSSGNISLYDFKKYKANEKRENIINNMRKITAFSLEINKVINNIEFNIEKRHRIYLNVKMMVVNGIGIGKNGIY